MKKASLDKEKYQILAFYVFPFVFSRKKVRGEKLVLCLRVYNYKCYALYYTLLEMGRFFSHCKICIFLENIQNH